LSQKHLHVDPRCEDQTNSDDVNQTKPTIEFQMKLKFDQESISLERSKYRNDGNH
jgi:hypothetical protein